MHYFREITVLSKFYEKLLLFPAVDRVARNNHLRCRYFAVAWSDGRKPQVVGHRNDAVPRSVTRYQGRLLCLHSVSLCYVCAWRRWRRLLRFPARFSFSGRVINPACVIAPRHDRIDVSCQHHSPEQVALTNNRPRYAMPDNRGEVSIHWRNAQHSEADVIIRYR